MSTTSTDKPSVYEYGYKGQGVRQWREDDPAAYKRYDKDRKRFVRACRASAGRAEHITTLPVSGNKRPSHPSLTKKRRPVSAGQPVQHVQHTARVQQAPPSPRPPIEPVPPAEPKRVAEELDNEYSDPEPSARITKGKSQFRSRDLYTSIWDTAFQVPSAFLGMAPTWPLAPDQAASLGEITDHCMDTVPKANVIRAAVEKWGPWLVLGQYTMALVGSRMVEEHRFQAARQQWLREQQNPSAPGQPGPTNDEPAQPNTARRRPAVPSGEGPAGTGGISFKQFMTEPGQQI